MKQCLTTVLLCTLCTFNVSAGDPVAGEAKAAICASCHGPAGNSVNPEWPKLAGQHAKYTAKQVRDFMAGVTRNDALMAPMIAGLSDEDIEDIAAYYANQSSTGGFAGEELHALGERLYRGGNMESGVPACIACHGPRGAGNEFAGFPRVAGQARDLYHAAARGLAKRNPVERSERDDGRRRALSHAHGDEGGQRVHRRAALNPNPLPRYRDGEPFSRGRSYHPRRSHSSAGRPMPCRRHQ